jgi:PhnB protein
MYVQPYVFFNGRCEEALDYYCAKLGAEVILKMRYKEVPPDVENQPRPDLAEKIMHASVKLGSTNWMASDGHCDPNEKMSGFSLSLTTDDAASAKKYFDALADGGQVVMPLQPTFWSTGFGMLVDRFGLMWMVSEPDRPGSAPA